jgi:hypothetical protein
MTCKCLNFTARPNPQPGDVEAAQRFVKSHLLCPDDAGTAIWMAQIAAEFAASQPSSPPVEVTAENYEAAMCVVDLLMTDDPNPIRITLLNLLATEVEKYERSR